MPQRTRGLVDILGLIDIGRLGAGVGDRVWIGGGDGVNDGAEGTPTRTGDRHAAERQTPQQRDAKAKEYTLSPMQ